MHRSPLRPTFANPRGLVARPAVTLIEMTVAVAIMVVVFSTVVPVIRGIRNTWNTRQANADLVQNGRVLIEHLRAQLVKAKKVTAVSGAAVTNGHIEFRASDGTTYRYDRSSTTGYVEFGPVGSLVDLAGPVSTLKFACYDIEDLSTPITDGEKIRLVKIETTLVNSGSMAQSRTWTTSVELRCNITPDEALVGWWRFNESSGLTAVDSSGYGRDGTLVSMAGTEWRTGVLNKALLFDGYNDHVTLPIGSVVASSDSMTVAAWVNFYNDGGSWERIFDFGTGTTKNMFLTPSLGSYGDMRFAITTGGYSGESRLDGLTSLPTGWHHVAVTIDGGSNTMRLYQDGSMVDSGMTATLPSDLGTTTHNYLGRSQYAVDDYFRGELDEVRLYNYVLSSAEITDLFAVGDLVQHLAFDETSGTNANDDTGSNDGTFYNTPTWTAGYWSNCLSFDGVNDGVYANRTISNSFTIAFWFKTSRYAHGGTDWGNGDGMVDMQVSGSTLDFGTAICDDRAAFGVGGTTSRITVRSTGSVVDGVWHHLVATRNSSGGKIQLFIDGVLQAEATGPTTARTADTYIAIGGSLTGDATKFYQGQIDDVRFYTRVLTQAQILILLE